MWPFPSRGSIFFPPILHYLRGPCACMCMHVCVCVRSVIGTGFLSCFVFFFLPSFFEVVSTEPGFSYTQKALQHHIQLLHGCLTFDLKSSGLCSRTLLTEPLLLPSVGCFSNFVLEPSIYQPSINIHTYTHTYIHTYICINQSYDFIDNFTEEQCRSSAFLQNLCL